MFLEAQREIDSRSLSGEMFKAKQKTRRSRCKKEKEKEKEPWIKVTDKAETPVFVSNVSEEDPKRSRPPLPVEGKMVELSMQDILLAFQARTQGAMAFIGKDFIQTLSECLAKEYKCIITEENSKPLMKELFCFNSALASLYANTFLSLLQVTEDRKVSFRKLKDDSDLISTQSSTSSATTTLGSVSTTSPSCAVSTKMDE